MVKLESLKPFRSLSANERFNCYVTWARDVDGDVHIYTVKEQDKECFDQLDSLVHDIANNDHQTSFRPKQPELCLAFFEGSWARGLCMPMIGTNKCRVFYLDYGNDEEISCEYIRPLPQQLRDLPLYTNLCILRGKFDNSRFKEEELRHQWLSGVFEAHVRYLSTNNEPIVDLYVREAAGNVVALNDHYMLADSLEEGVLRSVAQIPGHVHRLRKADLKGRDMKPGDKVVLENIIDITDGGSKLCGMMKADDIKKYQVMSEHLNGKYGREDENQKYQPVVGEVVAGKFSGEWYRGEVRKVDNLAKKAKVYYVDYGNEEEVNWGCVRCLAQEFKELPMLALEFSLSGLPATKQISATEVMPYSTAPSLDIVSVGGQGTSGRLYSSDRSSCLNDCLAPPQATPATPMAMPSRRSLDLSVVKLEQMRMADIPLNTKQRCELVEFKGVNEILALVIPSPGPKMESAKRMNEMLASFVPAGRDASYRPSLNDMVIAKYEGAFYRGLVEEDKGESFLVFFTDFGNTDVVSMGDIHRITPAFTTQDMMAVKCSLRGVDPSFNFQSAIQAHCGDNLISVEALGERHSIKDTIPVRLFNADGSVCISDLAPAPAPLPQANNLQPRTPPQPDRMARGGPGTVSANAIDNGNMEKIIKDLRAALSLISLKVDQLEQHHLGK